MSFCFDVDSLRTWNVPPLTLPSAWRDILSRWLIGTVLLSCIIRVSGFSSQASTLNKEFLNLASNSRLDLAFYCLIAPLVSTRIFACKHELLCLQSFLASWATVWLRGCSWTCVFLHWASHELSWKRIFSLIGSRMSLQCLWVQTIVSLNLLSIRGGHLFAVYNEGSTTSIYAPSVITFSWRDFILRTSTKTYCLPLGNIYYNISIMIEFVSTGVIPSGVIQSLYCRCVINSCRYFACRILYTVVLTEMVQEFNCTPFIK